MIMRVWGLINLQQALNLYHSGDKWGFAPPKEDGMYICEFWAENDFGNIGYKAAILYIYGGMVKCIRVLSKRYRSSMHCIDRYKADQEPERWSVRAEPVDRFVSEQEPERWTVKMRPLTCPREMMEVLG